MLLLRDVATHSLACLAGLCFRGMTEIQELEVDLWWLLINRIRCTRASSAFTPVTR